MDNTYMHVLQSVDERWAAQIIDEETGSRIVVGIQPSDQGEIHWRLADGTLVGKMSSPYDFEMIAENENANQEEEIIIFFQGEKTRLWELPVPREWYEIDDADGAVLVPVVKMFGTVLITDNLGNDRPTASGFFLPLAMELSTTRGARTGVAIDTSENELDG